MASLTWWRWKPTFTMTSRVRDVRVEPIPDDMKELAQKYHDEMVEAAAETDEALMEKYRRREPLQGGYPCRAA